MIRNTITNKPQYCIAEATTADGPNIITGNVALTAVTAQISALHAASDVSHNLTT